jgi:hypothetical protein
MAAESDSDNGVPHVLALEREILRSLCNSLDPALPRDAILRSLSHHKWLDPDHRVVYEALRRIPLSSPAAIRDQLPAAATRMGFPDVDWQPYFESAKSQTAVEIEALIRALASASAPGSR